MHLSCSTVGAVPEVSWRVPLFLSLLGISAVTLFPYWGSAYSSTVLYDYADPQDEHRLERLAGFALNIALFIPLGLSLAGAARHRARIAWQRASLAALLGFAISAAVETAQTYMPSRVPSSADLLANTTGAVAGALLYTPLRAPMERSARRLIEWLARGAAALNRPVVCISVALLVLATTTLLQYETSLHSWDPGYPLTVASEADGSRAWQGTVQVLEFSDRAADSEEARRAMAEPLSTVHRGHVRIVREFDLSRTAGQTSPDPQAAGGGLMFEEGFAIAEAVRASGQFTARLAYQTAEKKQFGPARIITLSADGVRRNFTIGHQGDALVLRVRSGFSGLNGREPEFSIPEFFTTPGPQVLVVAYDGRKLSVRSTARRVEQVFRITPGSVAAQRLDMLHVDELFGHQILFLVVALFPAALHGAGVIVRQAERTPAVRACTAIGFALLPALGLETWLSLVSGSALDSSIGLSGVLCGSLLLATIWALVRPAATVAPGPRLEGR